jgi:hypothetical protein
MPKAMRPDTIDVAPRLYPAVKAYDEMIAYIIEAALQMPTTDILHREILFGFSCRAVDDNLFDLAFRLEAFFRQIEFNGRALLRGDSLCVHLIHKIVD